jgi:hypothetical protein
MTNEREKYGNLRTISRKHSGKYISILFVMMYYVFESEMEGVYPQALVSFKKYMPHPLPYFKVNIYPFPLPHFASIFFAICFID